MAKSAPLAGLVIRTAVVRGANIGYILAGNPKLEEEEIDHTVFFKWDSGKFIEGELGFTAHTCCLITKPRFAIVMLSGEGLYGVATAAEQIAENLYEVSDPPDSEERTGDMRWVAEIAGKAYAVGHSGSAYRLDGLRKWTRIDEQLPRSFKIEAIHGFGGSDLYAVGKRGLLWHFDGKNWTQRELPTNVNLSRVKCAEDGSVYVAGHHGMLIRGRDRVWSVISQEATTDDIWSVEWYRGRLYVATMEALYRLEGDDLVPVDFGKVKPDTYYHLSAADGVMWSIGEEDIVSFDGKSWKKIV